MINDANNLVLSLFPGIGLLDRAFEEEGFCVVRGPDVLWGGDVKKFHPPAGRFDGIIGGPPCKPWSKLKNLFRSAGYESRHPNLIPEFERVVSEARPEWFLMEEVPEAPEPCVPGYIVKSELLNNRWLAQEQNRLRRFSFGTRDGRQLLIETVALEIMDYASTVRCRELSGGLSGSAAQVRKNGRKEGYTKARPLTECIRLQGLPEDFLNEAPFTLAGKYEAVGNGVPLPMGRAIAKAVRQAISFAAESAYLPATGVEARAEEDTQKASD
jgi:DNA (cytosine-5)-methyltransferase 1